MSKVPYFEAVEFYFWLEEGRPGAVDDGGARVEVLGRGQNGHGQKGLQARSCMAISSQAQAL